MRSRVYAAQTFTLGSVDVHLLESILSDDTYRVNLVDKTGISLDVRHNKSLVKNYCDRDDIVARLIHMGYQKLTVKT